MSFKAIDQAQMVASGLALRLKGLGQSGADIAVSFAFTTVGSGPGSSQPCVLVGTQGTGAHTNSFTLLFLPEQLNVTTGVASNVQNNSIGLAQEVYGPHYIRLVQELDAATHPCDSELTRLRVWGCAMATGMRVELAYTNAGTAPTPANAFTATTVGSFNLDQYNPLTNQS